MNFWKNNFTFILASIGSTVGLVNIWKFPYLVGINGGSAFIVIYLGCIILIGIPLLISEMLIGYLGKNSPPTAIHNFATKHNANNSYGKIGLLAVIGAIMILSFYSVVGGWSIEYLFLTLSNRLNTMDKEMLLNYFQGELLQNPIRLALLHTIFIFIIFWITSKEIRYGIEKFIIIFMPIFFILLVIMFLLAIPLSGFKQSINFMFSFNLQSLTPEIILAAIGHAFFSLGIGIGAMMIYASYIKDTKHTSLHKTACYIAIFDTLIALMIGVIIFTYVFQNNLDIRSGPGLLFISLPLSFQASSFGNVFAIFFYIFVFIAAISSAISIAEPVIKYFIEKTGMQREYIAGYLGYFIWLLGILCLLSFNTLSEFKPILNLTFFDLFDKLTTLIILPVTALFIGLLVSRYVSNQQLQNYLNEQDICKVRLLLFVLRNISIPLLILVFIYSLLEAIPYKEKFLLHQTEWVIFSIIAMYYLYIQIKNKQK